MLMACGPSFVVATPPGFVELEDDNEQSQYAYRATNADGLVIAVREIEHEPEGELSFWTRAIENQMRSRGGYALIEQKDVKTLAGLVGKQLIFGHDEENKPNLYYVTVFSNPEYIYLLEAGGKKELVEAHKAQLKWAVENFRPN
jgi:hypothetical protein